MMNIPEIQTHIEELSQQLYLAKQAIEENNRNIEELRRQLQVAREPQPEQPCATNIAPQGFVGQSPFRANR